VELNGSASVVFDLGGIGYPFVCRLGFHSSRVNRIGWGRRTSILSSVPNCLTDG
jgi:hypothetical protein